MRIPAEWAQHQAMWTAYPSHADLWQEDLEPARSEVMAMAKALAAGEKIKMLAMDDEAVASARRAAGGANIEIVPAQFGDIWLRDTAPLFSQGPAGLQAQSFRFNGWGGKYDLPFDGEVSDFVGKTSGASQTRYNFVLEGGSLDFDGTGSVLTTKECLLNANRNPGKSQSEIEDFLRKTFDITKIIWLTQGLANDHTDGHIDNIARFVAPGKVVCQSPSGDEDPNTEVFATIAEDLNKAGLEVIRIPSPGLITDDEEEPVAASHMNFIIGNAAVVVPAYEDIYVHQAVRALEPLFPGRKVIALPARHVLTGGGSFHCITQQEPSA